MVALKESPRVHLWRLGCQQGLRRQSDRPDLAWGGFFFLFFLFLTFSNRIGIHFRAALVNWHRSFWFSVGGFGLEEGESRSITERGS